MEDRIDFLRVLFVVLQIPIVSLIIVLCYRAGHVLHLKPMKLILAGFFCNLCYLLLNVFSSGMFTRLVMAGSTTSPGLALPIETFDLLTFALFMIAFCMAKPRQLLLISLSVLLFVLLFGWHLTEHFSHKAPASIPGPWYLAVASLYKALSIFLLILFFKAFFSWTVRTWALFAGLGIWLLLQFPDVILYGTEKNYEYILFFIATLGKIFIATSLFTEPILHEFRKRAKEQERQFERILEITFHEINLPMSQMELNLAKLSKGDSSRGQRYQELESDYEKIKTVILNAHDAFKHQNNDFNNIDSNGQEEDSGVNLNKIIQKCTVNLKHNFEDTKINFRIRFGQNVHALGNAAEITQIITNIIKNAIEAYPADKEEKEIQIISGYKTIENVVEKFSVPYVEITDFAAGIKKDEWEKIWEQGWSTKIDKTIKGQGLYVVQHLSTKNIVGIKMHSIHVSDKTNHKKTGTTFTLTFRNV